MGTTAEKGAYLNNTKLLLKQKINNLGGDITDQTTFRQYADKLQNVYDILPKTNYAEGSNITLSNTLKGKLDFEDGIVGYGDTKQEGTPTPDNPQDIEVVRGKNRFNKATVTPNAYINTSGNLVTGAVGYSASDYIKVSTGDITWSATTGNGYSLSIYDSSKTFIRSVGRTSNSAMTIPINNGEEYIRFTLLTADLNITQIEKGSQATSYLPYNTIEVVERGKNLWGGIGTFNYQNIATTNSNGTIDVTANEQQFTSATTPTAVTNNLTKILKAGTYTFSVVGLPDSIVCQIVKVNSVTSGAVFKTLQYGQTLNTTFTITEDMEYFIRIQAIGQITYQGTIKPMIEQGSTATTYEPYQTPQTYQLSLGEYEFAKIGNYVDTIEYDVDEDKVYKNEKIGKTTSDTIVEDDVLVANQGFYFNPLRIFTTRTKDLIYSNTQTNKDTTDTEWNTYNGAYIGHLYDNYAQIYINYKGYTQVETNLQRTNIKNWLKSINFYMYYPLREPTKKEITTTLKDQIKALYYSHSFNGTTIIEIDGQLPLIIKVRALKGE